MCLNLFEVVLLDIAKYFEFRNPRLFDNNTNFVDIFLFFLNEILNSLYIYDNIA